MTQDTVLDYKIAGVDITKGNELVNAIKPLAKATQSSNVLSNIGGFAGLFELPQGYKQPVLVSGTDGVGTKLKLAHQLNKHDTIGIDLVAMCVNDIIVTGAAPLYFLDYYACAKLDKSTAYTVIKSISTACSYTGMSLLGGETAEMPGIYQNNDYDLAGFCVGVVEKDKILNPDNINPEDTIIALSSSGVHSNGFSLVRKILETNNIALDYKYTNHKTLGEELLTPTVLYTHPLLELINQNKIKACAHITGGGLAENTERVIPDGLCAHFDLVNYKLPDIFSFLQQQGNIETNELWRTFNCGIGMVLITAPENADYILDYYNNYKFTDYNYTQAFKIGFITKTDKTHNNQIKALLNNINKSY